MAHIYSLIDDKKIEHRPVVSLNPATGEIWQRHEITSPKNVAEVIETARNAQPDWFAAGFNHRRKILTKLHEHIFEARNDLVKLITKESGKPAVEALIAEVITTLDFAKFYLKHGKKILRTKKWRHQNIAVKAKRAEMVKKPWGVVGIITPWNYPLQLVAGAVFPALLAGNTVVVKPAEYTTAIALKFADLVWKSGVPRDVFHILPGDASTGAALIENSVDKVVFIGSERAGREVAKAASEKFIPITLELGGSDPMIVLQDAPVKNAVASAIWGRFMNAGQTCVAVKRVYVEEAIYDEFIKYLVAGVKKLRLGPGDDPKSDVGPIIREVQIAHLEEQLHDAIEKGAKILCGGHRRTDIGKLFFEPTVLANVTPEMAVLQEETFGPLLPIVCVKDAAEAVEMANATRYGLSASIWTKNLAHGRELAQQIQAGAVTINDASFHPGVADVPYGGFKSSGLGKSHGDQGLLAMVREQYIDIDPLATQYKPWWFGYSPDMLNKLDRFATYLHAKSLLKKLASIPASIAILWHRNRL